MNLDAQQEGVWLHAACCGVPLLAILVVVIGPAVGAFLSNHWLTLVATVAAFLVAATIVIKRVRLATSLGALACREPGDRPAAENLESHPEETGEREMALEGQAHV